MTRNHFIAGAIKHVGALHRDLGVPPDQKIPMAKIEAASHGNSVTAHRARMAIILKQLAAKRRK